MPVAQRLVYRVCTLTLAGIITILLVMVMVMVVVMAQADPDKGNTTMADHPYVGLWVTEDGHIRHELLPSNRYDEARGARQSAYQGRYRITGNYIEYWDDTGFTADGEFIDDVLYHAGMVLYRSQKIPAD